MLDAEEKRSLYCLSLKIICFSRLYLEALMANSQNLSAASDLHFSEALRWPLLCDSFYLFLIYRFYHFFQE